MKDNRHRYNDCWYEDGPQYRYNKRRTLRHFERDLRRLMS